LNQIKLIWFGCSLCLPPSKLCPMAHPIYKMTKWAQIITTCPWKKAHNDLQNITQKAKDWATQTPLKSGGEHNFFQKGYMSLLH
jgi:hypothetical protein